MKTNEVASNDYYKRLNFHPLDLSRALGNWLIADRIRPLVLQGEIGCGRSYLVQAAAYNTGKFGDHSFRVAILDCRLQEVKDLASLVDHLDNHQTLNSQNRAILIKEVSDLFGGKVKTGINGLFLSLSIQIGPALSLIRKLSASFSIDTMTMPGSTPFTVLRRLLETALSKNNIIIIFENSELLGHAMIGEWLDIIQTLNNVAAAGDETGKISPVFSCSTRVKAEELLSLEADELETHRVDPLTKNQLHIVLDQRFNPHRFSDDLIHDLHWYGIAAANDGHGYPGLIAEAMSELLEKNTIIRDDDNTWVLNPYKSKEELGGVIDNIIGKPLRDLIGEGLNTIAEPARKEVTRFMRLAALCQQTIPQQLLLDYMDIRDGEQRDVIIDAVDDTFVDVDSPLLIDDGYHNLWLPGAAVYRFARPLAAISLRTGLTDQQGEAKNLLKFVSAKLPVDHKPVAGLCWQLAEQTSPEVREQWREQLSWYFAPMFADRFSLWLEERLNQNRISIASVLNLAGKMWMYRRPFFCKP